MIIRFKVPNSDRVATIEVPHDGNEWRVARDAGAPALSLFYWTFGDSVCKEGICYPRINRWSFNRVKLEVMRVGLEAAYDCIEHTALHCFSHQVTNPFGLLYYRLKTLPPADGVMNGGV